MRGRPLRVAFTGPRRRRCAHTPHAAPPCAIHTATRTRPRTKLFRNSFFFVVASGLGGQVLRTPVRALPDALLAPPAAHRCCRRAMQPFEVNLDALASFRLREDKGGAASPLSPATRISALSINEISGSALAASRQARTVRNASYDSTASTESGPAHSQNSFSGSSAAGTTTTAFRPATSELSGSGLEQPPLPTLHTMPLHNVSVAPRAEGAASAKPSAASPEPHAPLNELASPTWSVSSAGASSVTASSSCRTSWRGEEATATAEGSECTADYGADEAFELLAFDLVDSASPRSAALMKRAALLPFASGADTMDLSDETQSVVDAGLVRRAHAHATNTDALVDAVDAATNSPYPSLDDTNSGGTAHQHASSSAGHSGGRRSTDLFFEKQDDLLANFSEHEVRRSPAMGRAHAHALERSRMNACAHPNACTFTTLLGEQSSSPNGRGSCSPPVLADLCNLRLSSHGGAPACASWRHATR